MLSWIDDVKKFLSLAGDVIALVRKTVESFEVPGHGTDKKEAVLTVIEAALERIGVKDPLKGQLLGLAGAVIDTVVFILNLTGVFTHTPK